MNLVVIDRAELESAIQAAAKMGAERALAALQAANEPKSYTYTQAAGKLGVCRQTISRMVSAGIIKLNSAGKIPAGELKRASAAQGD